MSQGQTSEAQWPPRSPHEALLSTPSGRNRHQRFLEHGSPSPSPSKRSQSTTSFRNKAKGLLGANMDNEEGDEDDEETLQLQLQEIQARLKLKKLQKKAKQPPDSENESVRAGTTSLGRHNSVAASRAQSRLEGLREKKLERSKSQSSINVPVSPVRRVQPAEPQRSPGRVLLGIDKGLKGSDISLKRPPTLRNREGANIPGRLTGPFLQRPTSQTGSRTTSPPLSAHNPERLPSFNERLAAVRSQEAERQERDLRIKKSRSTAFEINYKQMQTFKETAVDMSDAPVAAPEFSRDEVLKSFERPNSTIPKSRTMPDLKPARRSASSSTTSVSESRASAAPPRLPGKDKAPSKRKAPPSEIPEAEATQFEPYSSVQLSKRIIPHQVLTRTLTGKKTFLIPDLLRSVKSPDFSLPDIEEDIVLFGIIAQKSEPRSHATNSKNQNRGKYMIMSLTDLKWEVDLYLFDSAFDKFWKMTTGTIIAILNPGIMPPPRGKADTGKFSLTLNCEEDTILEVGMARDLGFCKSIKKDGKTCDSWVNKRHTEFCDYHVNEALKKTHSSRMEVNTMTFGKGGFGARKFNSQDMTGHSERKAKTEEEKRTRYDRESQSHIFIGNKTSAKLLDDVDYDPDAFHRGSTKEERVTRRLLAQEKERDLARKLGAMGGGLGADYMRRREGGLPAATTAASSQYPDADPHPDIDLPPPPDAASLGLLGGKANDVALSPIKRKRTRANTVSSSAAVGWGSDLSKKLGAMKNGESSIQSSSHAAAAPPVRKKTRFVTEKGIREAGRESFGGDMTMTMESAGGGGSGGTGPGTGSGTGAFTGNSNRNYNDVDDDDDDDLDIVRE